jgi:hypothetical protein
LVQTPLQVLGAAAGHWQVPPVQVWPPVHALPHVPQFTGSVIVFVHVPLQLVMGAVQVPASPLLLLVLEVAELLVAPPVLVPPVLMPPVPLLELIVPLELLLVPPVEEDEPPLDDPPVPLLPQPTAALSIATAATPRVSHARRFIRLLLLGPRRAQSPDHTRSVQMRWRFGSGF